MAMKRISCGIIILLGSAARVFAADAIPMVREGNKAYKQQKYDQALKFYDQALSLRPDSAVIHFNRGAARYKTGEYQQATAGFEQALVTGDKRLESAAQYNLGNARYMLGVSKENADLAGAVQLLEGAVANYRRSLELNPKDEDAKINAGIVEEKLKELKERLKQQPPQQQGSCDMNKQGQNRPEQQSGGQQDKAGDPPQNPAQGENAGKQERAEKSAAEKSSGQKGAAENQPAPRSMSAEEAQMLLEGFRQDEKNYGVLRDDRKAALETVEKDW